MDGQTKREKRKELARQGILSVAVAEFSKHGFAVTTMDGIADASDWSKGALYTHFSSKEELFFTIVIEKVEIYQACMTDAISSATSLEELVRSLVHEEIHFFLKHGAIFNILQSEQHTLSKASGVDMQERALDFQQSQVQRVADKLHSLGTTSIRPQTLARSITGAIHSNLSAFFGANPDSLSQLETELVEMFTHGLRPHQN
jgi:AcrR family transcriptional regulator